MGIVERIEAARGSRPADLVLHNAMLVNVLSAEIYQTNIVVHDGLICALGDGYDALEAIDLHGQYVCPGFIDAHVHIESSLCTPPDYGRTVLARGVTTVVTDPHEIANVHGLDGIRTMLHYADDAPLDIFVMASSCVPATAMETSGATLEADELVELLNDPRVLGLAEVMNYPGVIHAEPGMLAKLTAFRALPIDGHAPAVTGKPLNAYVAAGIHTDHECTTLEEAQEKLRLGLTLFIREGTTTRNLRTLLPLVSPLNHTRMCFCTDDRQPSSLLDEGAIDHMVRVAIAEGIDPIMSIRMGSLNTANAFRLWDRGAVAVGRRADLIVFDDLHDLRAAAVFKNGVRVAETGRMIVPRAVSGYRNAQPSLSIDPAGLDFAMPAAGTQVHVIGADPNQVVTEHLVAHARIVDGMAVADPERDLLKIAVVERHHGSGRTGKGFISGVGLKRGALAGTVAHDHHNLVVIGADDTSMKTAARAVIALGGGLAAADGDQVLGTLALPVAGLMTDAPIDEVRAGYDELIAYARALGSTMHDPFMVMSFMGLEVIPKLKLTDFGLVDVEQFSLIDTFMDEGKHG